MYWHQNFYQQMIHAKSTLRARTHKRSPTPVWFIWTYFKIKVVTNIRIVFNRPIKLAVKRLYTSLILAGFLCHSGLCVAQSFASSQPAPRVEHWQKRQLEINTYLQQSRNLAAVKLLFVGDSITDFWLFDDNPWVSGQKYGRKIWEESLATPGTENFALNIGISGDRLEHVLYRILPKSEGGMGQLDSPALNPEFMIVMLGINNSWAAEQPVV